jgi:hypothetical protein
MTTYALGRSLILRRNLCDRDKASISKLFSKDGKFVLLRKGLKVREDVEYPIMSHERLSA